MVDDMPACAHEAAIRRLMEGPAYRTMLEVLQNEHERTVADIVTLTEIPSPPFGEGPRAEAYRAELASRLAQVPR